MLCNYDEYEMTVAERIKYTLLAAVFLAAVGYIFYRSIILCIILMIPSVFFPKIYVKTIIEKRKKNLNYQFKDALFSLASSMGAAGKSPESAFKDALKDLSILYPDSETDVVKEFAIIANRIEVGETIEDALADFAHRANLEDISNFVDAFVTCKRRGGNLVTVIRNTSKILADKIDIKREIDTMISSKRFEQKLLMAMPVFFVLFLSVSAADYMEPMFSTLQGHLIMTVVVAIWAVSYVISAKIMNIEV